jgi:hypothetical protein
LDINLKKSQKMAMEKPSIIQYIRDTKIEAFEVSMKRIVLEELQALITRSQIRQALKEISLRDLRALISYRVKSTA